ncbi:hypothetical protein CIP107521_00846 [Corynebacterium diphtheriae]|nr:hypothetical protein CIP107521_00846 [Corynebacterium diphtheriae]
MWINEKHFHPRGDLKLAGLGHLLALIPRQCRYLSIHSALEPLGHGNKYLINTAGSVIDTKVMNHHEPAGPFYQGYQCAGAITGDNEVTFPGLDHRVLLRSAAFAGRREIFAS